MNRNSKMILPLKKAKKNILMNLYNSKGWSTDKKYIVFESDDWGSIRTSSLDAYQKLMKAGEPLDKDPFTKYDALESEEDLEALFEELYKHKDKNGRHPVITANCAVANPDFEKIREANFEKYFFEPFTETLKRYSKHENCFELWKSGMASGVFFPQLHCREHVNITNWLKDLRNGHTNLQLAFKYNMISGYSSFSNNNLFAYMDAFNYFGSEFDELLENIVADAHSLFYNILGYESDSFVASCYVWNDSLEKILNKYNIKYIQGIHSQFVPADNRYGSFDKRGHIIGKKNKYDQLYLVRNCKFEPALMETGDAADLCLKQIENSFRWRKPAVICTHRLNYIGYIDESNRNKNIRLLKLLLNKILKQWPDAEFITSAELGMIINNMDCEESR